MSDIALSLVAAFAVTAGATAHAQTTDPSEAGEILVVAQKRGSAESIQDVPIAMSVFGGDQLVDRGIRDLGGLNFSVPNVNLASGGTTPGVQNFSIRGLGLNSTIPSIDPTVGVFQDGVYLGVTYGALVDLSDVEAVEVLRGPVGVLFGKNVTGGAVLVRTREPKPEFSVRTRASVATGLDRLIYASVEGPLGEAGVAARLSGYYRNDGGWFRNRFNGNNDLGRAETFIVRPALAYRADNGFKAVVRLERGRTTGDGGLFQNAGGGTTLSGHDLNIDTEGNSRLTWLQATGQIDTDLFGGVVTAIAGYREIDHFGLTDIDGTPVRLLNAEFRTKQDQLSVELRFFRSFSDWVDLTTGLYYFNQDILYRERRLSSVIGGGLDATMGGNQAQDSFGAFANGRIALGRTFAIDAGLRYTREEKDAKIATFVPAASLCDPVGLQCAFDFSGSHSWTNWTPRLSLQWQPSTDVLAYLTWGKGFRSGGYNFRNTVLGFRPAPTGDEKQDSFELGVKSDWFARALRVNVAIFSNRLLDVQREIQYSDPTVGSVQVIANVGDVRIRGAEAEIQARVASGLTLSTVVGYVHGRYTAVAFDLNRDGRVDATDKGLELPRLAPWTLTLAADYEVQMSDRTDLSARVSYSFQDRNFHNDGNLPGTRFSRANILNASLSVELDRRWTFAVTGQNLLNDEIRSVRAPILGNVGAIEKGRVVGGEIRWSF
ncbi:TonB-dependent receptor [Sphingosinicella microcystinivorans]|uniref:Iron complex outermembrane receptor protein n=1 Tax=Sphingosinicella microcystinivorans TaxID=335406 RepID=A0AAD1D2N9_SPHMI|nr:TonB-dependent receptor [Sphingosinicella microcystinivorans]RKS88724.1 iron complex outermembrane receptor protein [Sphingosinicella microcystinivorans]BBE32480.1 TonB-dependent receptor [Sphingosinicella microcystinivorans]